MPTCSDWVEVNILRILWCHNQRTYQDTTGPLPYQTNTHDTTIRDTMLPDTHPVDPWNTRLGNEECSWTWFKTTPAVLTETTPAVWKKVRARAWKPFLAISCFCYSRMIHLDTNLILFTEDSNKTFKEICTFEVFLSVVFNWIKRPKQNYCQMSNWNAF